MLEFRRHKSKRTGANYRSRRIADPLIRDEEEKASPAVNPRLSTFAKAREIERTTDRASEDVEQAPIGLGLTTALLNVVKTVEIPVVPMELEDGFVELIG